MPGEVSDTHGLVDAAGVHLADPALTQVEQPVEQEVAVGLEGIGPVVQTPLAGDGIVGQTRVAGRLSYMASTQSWVTKWVSRSMVFTRAPFESVADSGD